MEGKKSLIHISSNKYKVVMVKTVNSLGPVMYRVTNISTLNSEDVAAPDIFDRIINDGWSIDNIKCEHGVMKIIDENGYCSMDSLVVVDEFSESPSLYDYCLMNDMNYLLEEYANSNELNISSIKIDSNKKVLWICSEGHQLLCDIPTRISLGKECIFCKSENEGNVYSLDTWCQYTGNLDLKAAYNYMYGGSTALDVIYRTHKKVIINGSVVYIDTYIDKLIENNRKGLKGEKK